MSWHAGYPPALDLKFGCRTTSSWGFLPTVRISDFGKPAPNAVSAPDNRAEGFAGKRRTMKVHAGMPAEGRADNMIDGTRLLGMLNRCGLKGVSRLCRIAQRLTIMRLVHATVTVSQRYIHPSLEAVELAYERMTAVKLRRLPTKFPQSG